MAEGLDYQASTLALGKLQFCCFVLCSQFPVPQRVPADTGLVHADIGLVPADLTHNWTTRLQGIKALVVPAVHALCLNTTSGERRAGAWACWRMQRASFAAGCWIRGRCAAYSTRWVLTTPLLKLPPAPCSLQPRCAWARSPP